MKSDQSTFIVIEGTDGSGKGTQFELLAEYLRKEGYDVATFDFPRYDKESSHFVRNYLNGAYGSSDEVGPYTGSMFYAMDRFEAAREIRDALAAGKVVLANRYTGSNMAHQGGKFDNAEQRRGFFIWLDNLEFQVLNVPRPDMSIILRVPAETAQQLVDKKAPREYTDKKRDIHEADLEHLKRSVEVYDDLAQLFPRDFSTIDCVRSGELLSINDIQKLLREKVEPMLPPRAKPGKKKLVKTAESTSKTVSAELLETVVTSTDGNVYAFTDALSPTTIAAAMARLSRRGEDMRHILRDEFLGDDNKDEQLLRRVITAYGDDSVQQLAGMHLVVENASNLLTKKLERGRLAAYLEQSTRYIYFDDKDSGGKYKYYTPPQLDADTTEQYERILDTIFDTYSNVVHKLTDHVRQHSTVPKDEQDSAWKSATRAQACDAARPLLPVATTSTVGIYGSAQSIESMIMRLRSDTLQEARQTGTELLTEARNVAPVFFERADKPERGDATSGYQAANRAEIHKLARSYVSNHYGTAPDAVSLTDYWPHNELDIVPDMLYAASNHSLDLLRDEVGVWSYQKKAEVFEAYMGERLNRRHRPGRALEKMHYSWDIVCDYGIFRDLQRHRMVDDLEWQELSPRYGYDIPKLVENAGLSDEFEACFDLSLKLYSILQANGYAEEAQYATLLGHKLRWKVTYNARQAFHIHELRTSPQGHPGYRKLVKQMHEKLAEVHPVLASHMKFVDKGEDPELTRLAAERYSQSKLNTTEENT